MLESLKRNHISFLIPRSPFLENAIETLWHFYLLSFVICLGVKCSAKEPQTQHKRGAIGKRKMKKCNNEKAKPFCDSGLQKIQNFANFRPFHRLFNLITLYLYNISSVCTSEIFTFVEKKRDSFVM